MSNEQTLKMTELDYLTSAPHFQMIKAALPYINIQEQRFFSLLVKVGELERTVELFGRKEDGALGICSLEKDAPDSPVDMLNAMKPFGTEAEQDFIDMIVSFLQGSQLGRSYMGSMDTPSPEIPRPDDSSDSVHQQEQSADHDSDYSSQQGGRRNDRFHFPLDQLKNMLPPEQQTRLETAQMLMQTFQQFS